MHSWKRCLSLFFVLIFAVACGRPADLTFLEGISFDFGPATVSTTVTERVTLINEGKADGTVKEVLFTDDQFSLNKDQSNCQVGDVIEKDQKCSIAVNFRPRFEGEQTGKMTVRYTTKDKLFSVTIDLYGIGTSPLSIEQADVNYGQVNVTEFELKEISVRNNSESDVSLTGVSSTLASDSSSFQLDSTSSTCSSGMTLAPYEACQYTIAFVPQKEGNFDLEYSINFDANGEALAVSARLSGTGVLNCQINNVLAGAYQDGESSAAAQNTEDAANGTKAGEALTYNEGYNKGFNGSYSSAYQLAYDSSYNTGYLNGEDQGFELGYYSNSACTDGEWDGSSDGRSDGLNDGGIDGYQDGYDDGYASGYDLGYDDGCFDASSAQQLRVAPPNPNSFTGQCYNRGYSAVFDPLAFDRAFEVAKANNADYQRGLSDGRSEGQTEGQADGSDDGYDDGYDDGLTDGIILGEEVAYDECYLDAYENAYVSGYEDGYLAEYDLGWSDGDFDGYEDGYEDGQYDCDTDVYYSALISLESSKSTDRYMRSFGKSTKLFDQNTKAALKAKSAVRGKLSKLSSHDKLRISKLLGDKELRQKLRLKKASSKRIEAKRFLSL